MEKSFYALISCCLLFILLATQSCNNETESVDSVVASSLSAFEPTTVGSPVKIFTLNSSTFNRELVSNGKVTAINKANLKFRLEGIIDQVLVTEGMSVNTDQVIATLNSESQERFLEVAMLKHRKALLEYEDQLLRLGYKLVDTTTMDSRIKEIAQLRSGVTDAEVELRQIKADWKDLELKAPFAGKIANLNAKRYNSASSFDHICTLVDDTKFHVEFIVLEQELDFVRASKTVRIMPFSDTDHSYIGSIISINPLVDKGGMVAIKALVINSDKALIDGMAVQVIVSQSINDQLIIPKEALLERQGKKVVFTTNDEKTAYWNYVTVSDENSTEYSIADGLKEGDKIIYDGNFNLAHEKPIRVVNGNEL